MLDDISCGILLPCNGAFTYQPNDALSTGSKYLGACIAQIYNYLSFNISFLTLHSCCMFKAQTTVLPNGLMQDEFERTSVNMSTYLVALIVAEFTSLSQNVSDTLVCPTLIWCSISGWVSASWMYLTATLCLGVCVLCAREEGSHRLRSGNHSQTAGVLQQFLRN